MTYINRTWKMLMVGLLFMAHSPVMAQSYVSKNIRLALFSSTPLEDIRAVSDQCTGVLLRETREVAFQVPIKSFEFEKKLMQAHFNENYMESDRYPMAKFKGLLDKEVDFSKDGVYVVTVTGILDVHGVAQRRTIQGRFVVEKGQIQLNTQFKVACVDHKIKIPTLVFKKIAEEIDIRVSGKFNLLK